MKERQQYHSKQEPVVPIRKCKNNVPAIEIENAVCEQLKNHKPDIHFLRGFADRLNHCRQERKKLYVPELEEIKPAIVVNLAAQAGVRYSIDHPDSYIQSNIVGFFNILEACRHYPVKHLLFASSSSIYGNQEKVPFSVNDPTDRPISLYAATKKSDELMAYTYSHLYRIPATGLRFFTVYGPFGRPDMAYFKFANKIFNGETIQVYNNGDMLRDFTYVDDIVEGISHMLNHPPKLNEEHDPFKVYNIGNNHPVRLMKFIEIMEDAIGRKAEKEYLPMQMGDVYQTYADIDDLEKDFGFHPSTTLEEGLAAFAKWYKNYYHKE